MKRRYAACLFVLGFVAAGAFSGAVIAEVTTSTTTGTTTAATTTVATTTTTATPPANLLPSGVRVAGVRVGGLSPQAATAAVLDAFAKPLPVIVDRSKLLLDPRKVAAPYAATAVAKARISAPGTSVKVVVSIRGGALRTWVSSLQKRFERPAVDAKLSFRNAKPVIEKSQQGRRLDSARLTRRVLAALRANTRLPVRVHTRAVSPEVSDASFGGVIVINRELNRLYLYDGEKLSRTFAVATGQPIYPTPRGRWRIVVKWKNPWWYPPADEAWAKGLKPVPPGPSNPLGTRWMGLNAPGIGIHGTDSPTSIGYSASHGCVRMQVPDAEWLFAHVALGTTVYIV